MIRSDLLHNVRPFVARIGVLVFFALCATAKLPAQTATETTLHTFAVSEGITGGQLIQAADGNYYGVTASAVLSPTSTPSTPTVLSYGGIFRLSPTGTYTQIYTFTGGSDGAFPVTLLQGPDGNLYGLASGGGPVPAGASCYFFDCGGTIFQITPAGVFTVLHAFGTSAGGTVPSSMVLGADGNFYGTTIYSPNGRGTIFKMTLSGVYSTLYDFGKGANGGYPETLVQGSDGFFYGMTQLLSAGADASGNPTCTCGTIFKVDTSGNLTTLYTFGGKSDGVNFVPAPGGAVAENTPQPLIIITQPGQQASGGGGGPNVEDVPMALVESGDGNFYGTTPSYNFSYSTSPVFRFKTYDATIFRITPAGSLTTLYTFSNPQSPGSDGGGSGFGLTFGGDGNLYGSSGNVLFSFTPVSGSTSITPAPLYTFTGGADGSLPQFLLASSGGTFVGATSGITSTNTACASCGIVFSLAPSAPVPAPVQVSILPRSGGLFAPLLTWVVPNAYSLTAQQCYAFEYGGAGGGTWTGKQTGTLTGNLYTGSAAIEPTAVGTYTYALTCGGTVSGSATLIVPPLAITTTSLPTGYVGAPYTATLAAGGVAPYFWKVVGGALPAGLTLGTGTGVISGTPTGSGTSYFTVQVAAPDATSVTASMNLSITIAAPTLTLTPPALAVVRGSSQSVTVNFTGFATNSISLSCGYLPAYATCSFSPLVGTGLSGTQTLSIAIPLFVALDRPRQPVSPNHKAGEVSVAALFSVSLLLGLRRRRDLLTLLCVLILSIATVTLTSCNAGSGLPNVVPAGSYTVNINASAGTQNVTVPLQLTVQ